MTQAVAGYLDLGAGPPDAALVHRMLDAIAPAGLPSARAALVRGPVAMGALSLASNDGLTPKPPRVLEAGDMLVAADMRLYGDGAAQPETALMDALTRHGPKAARDLHGDFGLACWNAAADALWLMRDHVGVRPVFYTVRPGHHAAFASHPSALLQTGLASRALDETGIAQSVVMARPVAPRTRYRDVKTVRPGQTVTVSRSGAVEERRVWRLPLGQLIPLSENKAAVAEELRRLLIQAVHRRLDEAGPAFGHLSGGLDSTPIAVIAARHAAERGEDFHAYSIVEPEDLIDQDAGDERRFAADTVAMEPNMVPHWINPALPTDLAGTVDLDTGQIVHPDSVADQMGRDAAHRGIRVMLTGWAGDEVVSMRTHNWGSAELFWSGRIADAMERLRAESAKIGRSVPRLFFSTVQRRALRSWVRKRISRAAIPNKPDLAFLHRGHHASLRQRLHWDDRHFDGRRGRRAALENPWIANTLEDYAISGMRYGFSYAAPMADLDLMRFAVTIPQAWLWDGRTTRLLYRDAIKGLAPHSVITLEGKLSPVPLSLLRQAKSRKALLARLEELGRNERVNGFVDIPTIAAYVAALPDAEAAMSAILRYLETEDVTLVAKTDHYNAVMAAEFLAQSGGAHP